MLASIFVVGGFDAFRDPASKATRAEAVTEPLRQAGFSNLDTETLVRLNGGVQFAAGTLLAMGRFRRVACLLLMGTLIPTTYAGHRFWEETDRTARTQQMMNFLKNVGLMGGLIVTALDTEGAPSLGWRAKRRVHEVEGLVSGLGHAGASTAGKRSKAVAASASRANGRTLRKVRGAGNHARRRAGIAAADSAVHLAQAREGVRNAHEALNHGLRASGTGATLVVHQAADRLAEAARQLEPVADAAVHSGIGAATEALSKLGERQPTT